MKPETFPHRPHPSSGSRRVAVAQVSGTTFLWGTIPVGVKLALPSFSPYAISFLRYAFAMLFLMGVMAIQRKKWVPSRAPRWILMAGGVASAANYLFYNLGLAKTTASAASFIIQGESAVLVFLAWLFLRERWTAAKAGGVLICTVGVMIVGWDGHPLGELFNSRMLWGNVMVFAAGVSWAVYAVCQKAVASYADSLQSLVTFLGLATLFTGLFWALNWTPPHHLTPLSVADMVYMGVFGTGLSYLLLVLALQKMDAGTAGMWTTPLPLVSSILAYTLLHERPSIYTGVGGALVLAGLLSLSKHEDEAG